MADDSQGNQARWSGALKYVRTRHPLCVILNGYPMNGMALRVLIFLVSHCDDILEVPIEVVLPKPQQGNRSVAADAPLDDRSTTKEHMERFCA